jgi:hypothetical protein
MRTLIGVVVGLSSSCVPSNGEGTESAATTSVGTTSADSSTGTSGSEGGSSGGSSSSGAATTSVESTTGVDGSSGSDDTTPTSTTGTMPQPKPCGLADLDPSADLDAAIDEGDGVGQIPTVVGDVLLRNCGCHYTDMVPPGYVDYVSHHQLLATWNDFQQNFSGTFPQGYTMMPAYLAVEQRVVFHNPLPMPSISCSIDGDPTHRISDEDLAVMTDWLAAAAPDGASWP